MIQKIQSVFRDPFLRSSLLFSIVNLLSSAIAYVIIVIVSRRGGDLINGWSALNSLVTVFLTFTAGFSLYYSKTISRLAAKKLSDTEGYLRSSEKYLHRVALQYGWILFAILLGLAAVFKFLNWYQALLIGVGLYFELWGILYRMFFLGRLEYSKAMVLTFVAAITRFAGIVGLLYLNFGIDSLVIGNVVGSGLALLLSYWYARKVKNNKQFNVSHDFAGSIKASAALIMSSILLQAGQIVTQGLYHGSDKLVETTITMLNIFGSILFYGASAFLSLFVVNATRSESTAIYKKGTVIITAVTVLGILVVTLIWHPALAILKREEFNPLLPYFLIYSTFMIFYNLFYVAIQFLISQYKYREIFAIGVLIALTFALLVVNALIPVFHGQYLNLYNGILIISGFIIFIYSHYLIVRKTA